MRRVGEKQIEIAVVVVIEKHRGLRMADVAQPGLRRDVFEGAVPPVVEQRVPAPGAGYEQVGPTVVVVVGERGPDGDPIALGDRISVGATFADYDNDGDPIAQGD